MKTLTRSLLYATLVATIQLCILYALHYAVATARDGYAGWVEDAALLWITCVLGTAWSLRRTIKATIHPVQRASALAILIQLVASSAFLARPILSDSPTQGFLTLAAILLSAALAGVIAPLGFSVHRSLAPRGVDRPTSAAIMLSLPAGAALVCLAHQGPSWEVVAGGSAVVVLTGLIAIDGSLRRTSTQVKDFARYASEVTVRPEGLVVPDFPPFTEASLARLENEVRRREERLTQDAYIDAQARDQIVEARSLRTRFMAAMSHELRSPLNSVVGFAQVLEREIDGELTDGQRESVLMIRKSAEELLLLLTDIIDLARLEAGRLRLRREWVPSVEILTESIQRGRAIVEGRDVEIDVEMQPGLPPVHIDRQRVAQAVVALFRNAAANLSKTTVRLRAFVAGGPPGPERHLRVEILDAFGAIRREDSERIFRAFQEIRSPTGRRVGGLGMAFSLSRGLVRLHGGEVWVKNPSESGTVLCVALPLDPPGGEPGTVES